MQAEKVFSSILVPLDGSQLAESALTTAVWLAGKMDAQLTPRPRHREERAARGP